MDELEISGKLFISTRRAAKLHKYHSDYIGQLIRAKKVVGQKVGRSWYVDAKSLDAYFAKEGNAPASHRQEPRLAVEPVQTIEEAVAPEAEPEPEPEPEPIQVVAVEEPAEAVEEVVEEPIVAEVIAEDPEETKVTLRKEVDVSKKFDVEIVESEAVAEEESFGKHASLRESLHIPIRRRASAKKTTGLRYIDDSTPALPEIQKAFGGRPLSHITRMPQSAQEMDVREEEAPVISEDVYVRTRSGLWLPTLSIVTLGAIAFAVVAFGSVLINSHMVIEAGKTASVGYSLQ